LLPPAEPGYARNAVNLLAFQKFLLYVHYTREHVERGAYTLRGQLKVKFKATQQAQINERKVADSKRQLTLWIILLGVSFMGFLVSPWMGVP
jgi:osomolarity two-component system sensor histidine kinase SLN1